MALFDSTFAPYQPLGSRNLSLGDHGTDIAVIQAIYNLMLKTMNPPHGAVGEPIAVTGIFDTRTESTVKNIQRYFDLDVDGVVGPETYFVFGQGVGPHVPYGGPAFGSRELSEGMAGGDVIILQNRLNCFKYAPILGGPATGMFDGATAEAVGAFKDTAQRNGDTGFANNQIVDFGLYNAAWIYTVAGGRALFLGRRGFDVAFLQSMLTAFGHYTDRVTGYYDAATEAAVEAFQSAQGISIDGVVGPATYYQIGLKNPNPAPIPCDLPWPPTIVSECSVALSPISNEVPGSFGVAAVASTSYQPERWLNVIANNLPSPDRFGAGFTTYAFTLSNSATGAVTPPQVMLVVPSGHGSWAGSIENTTDDVVFGLVNVYPSNPTGSRLGTALLEGNLTNCE